MHEPNNGKCYAYAYTSWNNNINGMACFVKWKKQWKKSEIRTSDVCEILFSYDNFIKFDINNDRQYFNTTLLLDVMTVLDAAAKDKSQLP